jgi:transposase
MTVVSRDRSDLYANGITQGAPHAVQVVDRFHLVANLREALETHPFQHGHLCARSLAVETWFPF